MSVHDLALPDFYPTVISPVLPNRYHPDHSSALCTHPKLFPYLRAFVYAILPSWKHPLIQRMLVNQPICSHSKYYYVTGSGFIYLILYFISLASPGN